MVRFISNPSLVDESLIGLGDRVVAHLGVDYEPSHLVLDAQDYTQDWSLRDEFRDIAFSWTPDRPKDQVPKYLLEVMNEPGCSHLVWLSRRTMAFEAELFSWVLAHELRHVCQARLGFPRDRIRTTIRELRREPRFMNLPLSLFDPAEIDSELCALRTVAAIFREGGTADIASSLTLPRHPTQAYANFLLAANEKCLS